MAILTPISAAPASSGTRQAQLVGLASLLKLAAAAVGADGAVLYADESPSQPAQTESTQRVIECHPAGLAGRVHSLSASLHASQSSGILSTSKVLLPSAITRWLGVRPEFVCSSEVAADIQLLFWWKQTPPPFDPAPVLTSIHETLAALLAHQPENRHLRKTEERFEALLSNVTLGIVFTDALHGSRMNSVAADFLCLPPETTDTPSVAAAMMSLRHSCSVRTADESEILHAGYRESTLLAEYWICEPRSLALRVETHSTDDLHIPGRVWVFTDVTPIWESSQKLRIANLQLQMNLRRIAEEIEKRKAAETELKRYTAGLERQNQQLEISVLQSDQLANQDMLTGLANRRRFDTVLAEMIAAADRDSTRVAVFFIDLDKFKQINDTFGHDAGDELLKTVANALTGSLRPGDLVARFGGDEFACATSISRHSSLKPLTQLADRIRLALATAISRPTESGQVTLKVSATVGLSIYPDDARDAEGLLNAADAAMYLGKRQGGNEVTFFDAATPSVQ